jgi:hypothetical protein
MVERRHPAFETPLQSEMKREDCRTAVRLHASPKPAIGNMWPASLARRLFDDAEYGALNEAASDDPRVFARILQPERCSVGLNLLDAAFKAASATI